MCLGDRFGGGITKRDQDPFGPVPLAAVQFGHGLAKALEPEIVVAIGTLDSVQKGRQLDELVPGVQKVKVKDLLPRHRFRWAEYKANWLGGNLKCARQ
jgi:hypothetical protein